ncbi:hypothetical protein [Salinimicrobium sediminilitoris]|uniref:hypothetical protein n=1 Tax=Salinimicrobium sediminilitoris TaxID=2876715 RepID=UPI001E4AFFA2|nr:hypothetical protein [Salinimicrobium sediminilitoris]MCC8359760.1 hypothetical protein [Salinimicrobium sediminilitoris]
MIKKISISLFFSFLLVLSSCSKDDDQKRNSKDLLTGSWTLTATKVYTFYEGELQDVEEDFYDTPPYNVLTLEVDGSAYYETPEYEDKFYGSWLLEENNFKTDVRIEPGVVSSGPIYFFPEGEVLELNATHFSYKSMTLYKQRDGKSYSYYVETYFEK